MNDPMTVAHELWRPWPKISKASNGLGGRSHANAKFHWQVRLFKKHRYISCFIYIMGYELYFPSMFTVWHTDPLGDAGPACHGRKHWKWHIHHMSLQFNSWQTFKIKHLRRCSWCGKGSEKHNWVNHGYWSGDQYFHSKCHADYERHIHNHDPATCWQCQHQVTDLQPSDPNTNNRSSKAQS